MQLHAIMKIKLIALSILLTVYPDLYNIPRIRKRA